MKLYGKKSISEILVILLNIVILVGAIITVDVYYNTFWTNKDILAKSDGFIIAFLLTIGVICTFLIAIDLKKVAKTLVNKNPFTINNIKNLNKIAIECFIISGCYIGNILYNINKYSYRFINIDNRGIHTDTEPVIFFVAGIFLLILASVFKQALKYKEENDYTI
ncbi:DUF2975 domain-containing protein [Clostridium cagae]|uniref:DUF2975 domain-containing protein n=1 Tax=Clostridium cagae TaxID=2080751 RepID=UPI000CF6287C|nr:DUF2975 domain-containing protein [Clostridium cagae]